MDKKCKCTECKCGKVNEEIEERDYEIPGTIDTTDDFDKPIKIKPGTVVTVASISPAGIVSFTANGKTFSVAKSEFQEFLNSDVQGDMTSPVKESRVFTSFEEFKKSL